MNDSNKPLKANEKLQVRVLNRFVLNSANERNVLLFKLATLSAFVVLICCGLSSVFNNKFEIIFERVSLVAGFAMLMFYFFAVRMMLVVKKAGRLLSVK